MAHEGAAEVEGSITVLLDIDVFKAVSLDPSDSQGLWQQLDDLRDQKNRMFFAHVTEKAVEMFL